MAEPAVVLFPSPAVGHLIAMVELAKLILTHRPSLSVHILIASQAYAAGPTAAYIATAPKSITFHDLSGTALPPDFSTASPHPETLALELLRLNNPNVRRALRSISGGHRVHALVIDFFCTHALLVAKELGIPCYYFYTCAAAVLSLSLQLPTIHETTTESLKDLDCFIDFPGSIVQVAASDMPSLVLDRADKAYEFMLDSSINMLKTDGIIVNSFDELEPKSVKAIRDGLCVPDGPTPPIFCVGPLISSHVDENEKENHKGSEILRWLDSKPEGSVVFLCFGSLGVFSKQQLTDIATGLEKSGHRFLWVVRNPPPDPTRNVASSEQPDPDLESLLPEGFLDRTKERGLVVKSWAPQVAVLSHGSVGGFVTHCGWNSVLEAVVAGVPMVAWPLYAEQRVNKAFMVKEMKIAVAIELGFGNVVVAAAEVEERVRELMESEVGRSARERVAAMKEAAVAALSSGGSSRVALTKLVDSLKLHGEEIKEYACSRLNLGK